MCSIMGYCGRSADFAAFKEGFDKTISRGPDDSRIIDRGIHTRSHLRKNPFYIEKFLKNIMLDRQRWWWIFGCRIKNGKAVM